MVVEGTGAFCLTSITAGCITCSVKGVLVKHIMGILTISLTVNQDAVHAASFFVNH